jgi:hypothetical protein
MVGSLHLVVVPNDLVAFLTRLEVFIAVNPREEIAKYGRGEVAACSEDYLKFLIGICKIQNSFLKY